MVNVEFEEYKCVIKITDEDNTLHLLSLDKLHEKVLPDKCVWKHSEKRISITFKKWLETEWTKLLKEANGGKSSPKNKDKDKK